MNSIGHVVSDINTFEYIDDSPIKVTLTQGKNSTLTFGTYLKSMSYLVERIYSKYNNFVVFSY